MYACEVSTEGPSFSTIRSERLMKVYALPQENLQIEGKEVQYDVNDKINLSCRSGDGRPLPQLSWYINDNMASSDQLMIYPPKTNADGLQSTKLGLVFRATPNYFHRGVLRLRCTATLTLVYDFEAVEYVVSGTVKNKTYLTPHNKDAVYTKLLAKPMMQSLNKLSQVGFEVPSAVAKGQPIALHCNFDLEGDELYSVKYYKDYVEFYRYLPTDEPRPAQKFKLKGAYVDDNYSGDVMTAIPRAHSWVESLEMRRKGRERILVPKSQISLISEHTIEMLFKETHRTIFFTSPLNPLRV
ncbi:unnamed protein product [Oppiella nova]|uniref:CD80-like immunoglobulin C2-set domain-containing protein n=1 Tax=Oppiella nova TaxID=334625 RepID=A0A7R9M4K9_9ACAR|nr:unnamed protein product [Oppiella nova]CAG2170154.1 unnamed protein product [Oppiella nova]